MDRTSWVIGCTIAILLACLCFLVVASGGVIALRDALRPSGAEASGVPVTSVPSASRGTDSPVSIGTPEETAWAVHEPAPPEAYAMLDLLARTAPPTGDLVEQSERLLGKSGLARTAAVSAAPIAVGTSASFNIINMTTGLHSTVRAVMRYATPHVYFWVDETRTADDSLIRALVDRFENEIYPRDRQFFGSESTPGVDGDPHLTILFARGLGDNVGGYFSAVDEVPRTVYPYSNEHEMFYMNADTTPLMVNLAGGILAHEFQHMIQWTVDPNEDTWLNEGFSELAMLLNGFDPGGMDRMYLRHTDTQLNSWPPLEDASSFYHYGGSFLFVEYFYSRFGEDATQALVANPLNGLASVDDTLRSMGAAAPDGAQLTADGLMADFAAALLLNEKGAEGGRFGFTGYSPPPMAEFVRSVETCPTDILPGELPEYAIHYIRIDCPGSWRLSFTGQTVQKVVPVDPPEGGFDVWSNRGDQADTTLTRAFDLPAGSPATLQFQLWYDLEKDFDFAYLEVSPDGGTTWNIVRTPGTSILSKLGNNFGPGWTGLSGGGETAEWVDESVDLSAYAGKQILVRFETITDPAQNENGLLVDNIRIPEIGYATGFESSLDGWETDGFLRLQNAIPQTYRVELVRYGAQASVEEIPLDDVMRGEADLTLGADESAVLIVIPVTRFTTQPVSYQVEIQSR